MELNETTTGATLILAPQGQLDTATAKELDRRVSHHLGEGRHHFVVDLAGVEHLSSAALRVLLALSKRVRRGGHLVLCGAGERIAEVFAVGGFSRLFKIFPDRREALLALPAELSVTGIAGRIEAALEPVPGASPTAGSAGAPGLAARIASLPEPAAPSTVDAPAPAADAVVDAGSSPSRPAAEGARMARAPAPVPA